jgi:hypothetical protein
MKNARFWIGCAGLSVAAMLSVSSVAWAETVKFKVMKCL